VEYPTTNAFLYSMQNCKWATSLNPARRLFLKPDFPSDSESRYVHLRNIKKRTGIAASGWFYHTLTKPLA